VYRQVLGHGMTFNLQRRILPGLVWNQEVYRQRILPISRARNPLARLRLRKETVGRRPGTAQTRTRKPLICRPGFEPGESAHSTAHSTLSTRGWGSASVQRRKLRFDHQQYGVGRPPRTGLGICGAQPCIGPGRDDPVAHPEPGELSGVHTNRLVSAVLPHRVHAALVATSEKRKETEIYPTFDRANTRGAVRKVASPIGEVTVDFLPGPRPLFHNFAPMAMVEILRTRLSQFAPCGSLELPFW
jgi:hypothetical protein